MLARALESYELAVTAEEDAQQLTGVRELLRPAVQLFGARARQLVDPTVGAGRRGVPGRTDEALPEAERARQAPLDFAPDSPAIAAIGEFAEEAAA